MSEKRRGCRIDDGNWLRESSTVGLVLRLDNQEEYPAHGQCVQCVRLSYRHCWRGHQRPVAMVRAGSARANEKAMTLVRDNSCMAEALLGRVVCEGCRRGASLVSCGGTRQSGVGTCTLRLPNAAEYTPRSARACRS